MTLPVSREGPLNNTCDRCGKTEEGLGWFARGYRLMRLKRGESDPGNVCGACAGRETGRGLGSRILKAEEPSP